MPGGIPAYANDFIPLTANYLLRKHIDNITLLPGNCITNVRFFKASCFSKILVQHIYTVSQCNNYNVCCWSNLKVCRNLENEIEIEVLGTSNQSILNCDPSNNNDCFYHCFENHVWKY